MSDTELETLIACVEQVAEKSESLSRHFVANPATAVFEPVVA